MSITGVIKVLDVPDDACLTTVRELVLSLEKYLVVEFDEERITNVLVSANEPDTTNREIIWFRTDNSGNFLGIFVFVQGQWVQMFPPPQAITLMYGRSDDLPLGYVLADELIPGISAAAAAHLKLSWFTETPDPGYYSIFHVVYVGL